MIISIEGPVYPDQIRPNVIRILVNLIYFDFIGFQKYLDGPTIKYTQDEMIDEIVGSIGDRMNRRYQPCRNI
jgi:hypothetical protein